MDPNSLSLPDLYTHLASTGLIGRLLDLSHDEDLGPITPGVPDDRRDLTSWALIPSDATASLVITARAACTVSGLALMPDLLARFAPDSRFEAMTGDGGTVQSGAILGRLDGPQRQLLALERTMLNLLSRLSGIATRTAQHVAAIPPGCRARLYDTRKTTPGLRVLEKYAVRCGGGLCHRLGLYDAVLIKDNHLLAMGGGGDALGERVAAATRRAREAHPDLWFAEVEVDSLTQLERILSIPAGLIDFVLLDNMAPVTVARAVAMRDRIAPWIVLEVSGNVTLSTIAELARTGVERISSGSITHHAVWVDLGLDAE